MAEGEAVSETLAPAGADEIDPDFDWESRLLFSEHHQSHAASAFFPSPFEQAVVLTLDGVGEWATTTAGIGRGNTLEIRNEIGFPHSIGLLYSAFTYYTGFKVNSGEYKVMGLAPYGEPRFKDAILSTSDRPQGRTATFRLDQSYFDYCTGLTMTNDRFAKLFWPAGTPPGECRPSHMDIAASIQAVTDDVVLRLTRTLVREPGSATCVSPAAWRSTVSPTARSFAMAASIGSGFSRPQATPAARSGAALAALASQLGKPRNVDGADA